MSGQVEGSEKYITCSYCKFKYINDDKHINFDFGFNRRGHRYLTCTKCRNRRKTLKDVYAITPHYDVYHMANIRCRYTFNKTRSEHRIGFKRIGYDTAHQQIVDWFNQQVINHKNES